MTVRSLDLVLVVVMVYLIEISSKSKALEHAFTFLRLAFTDIRIETEAAYFLGKFP